MMIPSGAWYLRQELNLLANVRSVGSDPSSEAFVGRVGLPRSSWPSLVSGVSASDVR